MFGKELIETYPDAKIRACNIVSVLWMYDLLLHLKVIRSRCKDVDSWDQSFRETLIKGLRDSWWLKALSICSPDYFCLRQTTIRFVIDFYRGSFEKYGVDVYRAHYRQLENAMGERNYLQWTVEGGWYVAHCPVFNALYFCVFENH